MFKFRGKKCDKVGYFRNENNCKKFYRCYARGRRLARFDFVCASDHKNQPTAFDEK